MLQATLDFVMTYGHKGKIGKTAESNFNIIPGSTELSVLNMFQLKNNSISGTSGHVGILAGITHHEKNLWAVPF